jgi:RHH-type rel operon transcriptional repressor/antitoxin RelB
MTDPGWITVPDMSDAEVLYDVADHVATITLNAPERLNTISGAMLDQLSELTGRTKAFYLRQLIEAGLDDLEDAYLGAAVAERIRLGQERTYSLDDVVSELGLDPATL